MSSLGHILCILYYFTNLTSYSYTLQTWFWSYKCGKNKEWVQSSGNLWVCSSVCEQTWRVRMVTWVGHNYFLIIIFKLRFSCFEFLTGLYRALFNMVLRDFRWARNMVFCGGKCWFITFLFQELLGCFGHSHMILAWGRSGVSLEVDGMASALLNCW